MPWVRFAENFDFRPPEKRNVCIAFKAGTTKFVRSICAAQAVGAGKAILTTRPQNVFSRKSKVSRKVR